MTYPLSNQDTQLSLREVAHDYAASGWQVFPAHSIIKGRCSCGNDCSSPAKHPRTMAGLNQATTDHRQIDKWWRRWPSANVAVRTGKESGLVVLDVDPQHGGLSSLRKLIVEHGSLPQTLTVGTGSDGLHFYFKHPGGVIHNSAGTRLGEGLDIRGDGGYVIAPPSQHISGRCYNWANQLMLEDMPEWIHDRLRERVYVTRTVDLSLVGRDAQAWAQTALRSELQTISHAPEGQRNAILNRAAFNLGQITANGKLSEIEVRQLLLETAMSVGLSEGECIRTISSGVRAGSALPRGPARRVNSKADDQYAHFPQEAIQL